MTNRSRKTTETKVKEMTLINKMMEGINLKIKMNIAYSIQKQQILFGRERDKAQMKMNI